MKQVMKRKMSFIAAFLVFAGFGMIHGGADVIEKIGSVFIGIGAFYFLILLFKSIKRDKEKESSDQTTV
jgi:hypothetical protein